MPERNWFRGELGVLTQKRQQHLSVMLLVVSLQEGSWEVKKQGLQPQDCGLTVGHYCLRHLFDCLS